MIRRCCLATVTVLLAGCGVAKSSEPDAAKASYWEQGMTEASDRMTEEARKNRDGKGPPEGRRKKSTASWYDDSGLEVDAAGDAVLSDASAAASSDGPSE